MKIPIHWALGRRGNWDHGTMMLAEDGELAPLGDIQFEPVESPEPGSVVCFSGNQRDTWDVIRGVRNCLVVVLSDESADLDRGIIHPSNVVWQQYGRPGLHDAAAKWLLTGLLHETPMMMRVERRVAANMPRIRWSFVGQKQHTVREAFVRAVEGRGDGILHVSTGFGGLGNDGFPYTSYLRLMIRSDFVLCPPGNVSPDSFRVCEALECGAVPIVTGLSYWKHVFRNNPFAPVLVVGSAEEIPAVLAWDNDRIAEMRFRCAESWREYKDMFVQEIAETVRGLG